MKRFVTSEAVTEGHPDKICDKISDKILDTAIEQDIDSKMAVECSIKNNKVFIYGEAKTKAKIDYKEIALDVLKDIGYKEDFEVIVCVSEQSPEINKAVVGSKTKAGDQGIMFGYACRDTEELMPLPILLANRLCQQMSIVRKNDINSPLLPDGKSQVTVEYENNIPVRIDTIIVASQHAEEINNDDLTKYIIDKVIKPIIPAKYLDEKTNILVNTSGSFTIGGPFGDSGTTGRKIVVDAYGGSAKVGGGCYSSKDPSKVDRSAAYYARYVAKNIVFNNLSDICEIGVSYSIGKEYPIAVSIETFETNKVSLEEIENFVSKNFNFSVDNIIKELDLKRPIYYELASYGHYARNDLDLSWEKVKEFV